MRARSFVGSALLSLVVTFSLPAGAQQQTSSQDLQFEVASIRPSALDSRSRSTMLLTPSSNLAPTSGLLSANTFFDTYLMFAYDIRDPNELLAALPAWVDENQWDIEARQVAQVQPSHNDRVPHVSLLRHGM